MQLARLRIIEVVIDDLILRIDKQTFADDTYKVADPRGLIVDAQLAGWAQLRWHGDLVRKCGQDLKWSVVRHYWKDFNPELRQAVLRDLRDALIIILAPTIYRAQLEQTIAGAIGRPATEWPAQFRKMANRHIDAYEARSILIDSPLMQIQHYLEDDGIYIGPIGGLEGNTDEDRSLLTETESALRNLPNVRLFGARSAAAFAHLLEPDAWDRSLLPFVLDKRYISSEEMRGVVLATGEKIQRVFDEGQKLTVSVIADLKDTVRRRLADRGHLILPTDGGPPGAIEGSSADMPMLQAADLAAGYAKTIYLESGLRVVCEEFKAVVLNGAWIRDWSQVERPNPSELRLRK